MKTSSRANTCRVKDARGYEKRKMGEKDGLTTDDDDSLKIGRGRRKEREREREKKKEKIQKACRNVGRGSKRIGGFYLRMCASLVGGSLKCKPCDITNHFWEPCPGPDVGNTSNIGRGKIEA